MILCSIAFALFVAITVVDAQHQKHAGDIAETASLVKIINHGSNIEELLDRYFDSLNESDDKRRRDLTKYVWAEKGKFGTPYGEVEGLEAIVALVSGVQKKFPNATVRRTSRIDGFGNYLRWGFTLSGSDGKPILSGTDFAIVENGKLQLVMGFFDFAPNLERK